MAGRWVMSVYSSVCVIALIVGSLGYQEDLVTSLPDLEETLPFTHYSGYLKVNEERSFHYWLVESEHAPEEDPLVLWLNGGPGCSSMDGMFTENGPFRVNKGGGGLYLHPQRWNKIANMLYLESPAGVGFSYSTTSNYTTDDDQVASDNYKAMVSFYDKFPKYKGRQLFVTGESYAGIYIPTLLLKLMDDPSINLQGAAIGNGYMNPDLLEDTKFPFWYYHGMISSSQWLTLTDACCKNANHTDCQFIPFRSEECQAEVVKTYIAVMTVAVNPYNIYGTCEGAANEATRSSRTNRLISLMLKQAARPFDDISMVLPAVVAPLPKLQIVLPSTVDMCHHSTTFTLAVMQTTFPKQGYFGSEDILEVKADLHAMAAQVQVDPPCTDSSDLATYFHRRDVQTAIHVRTDLPTWTLCSSFVSQDGPQATYHRLYEDMTPQFRRILRGKIRLLIFNGDGDTVCNFFGDEKFIDDLKLPEVSPRGPWFYKSAKYGTQQVGGFSHRFEGLTYATVKGAGHMVPTDQPYSSFEMFSRFLQGVPL